MIKKTKYSLQPDPVLYAQGFMSASLDSAIILPKSGVISKGMFAALTNGEVVALYKSGKVVTGVSGLTSFTMYKDHSFGVGDTVYDGATARGITIIDRTSSDDYDTITVDGAVTFTTGESVYSIQSGDITAVTGLVIIADYKEYDADNSTYADVSVTVAGIAELNGNRLPNYWLGTTNPNNGNVRCISYHS